MIVALRLAGRSAAGLLAAALLTHAGCGPSDKDRHEEAPDTAISHPIASPTADDSGIPSPVQHDSDAYPLSACIVSNEPLDQVGEPVVIHQKGREVRFCCNDCADTFRDNPARFLAKLDRLLGPIPADTLPGPK